MIYLVTGAAGFIGMHTSIELLERGNIVIGIDNLNSYYDVKLKEARLLKLSTYDNFNFLEIDISNTEQIEKFFSDHEFDCVIHLAAQAGVRYSITNPHEYVKSNLQGFVNILEGCRSKSINHLVYASSSSVYGGNEKVPFSEHDTVDHPISLYAATKKSNELMAHTYSHLFGLPTTGLRFFTVYGPWGRPDMALFDFTQKILSGNPIDVFNHGNMVRDFTYIDDIVEGILKVADHPPAPNPNYDRSTPTPSSSSAPYKVFNIGNSNPIKLMDYVSTLEKHLNIKAEINFKEIQPGDVLKTYADVSELKSAIDFCPNTSIDEGIGRFVSWYKEFYSKNI